MSNEAGDDYINVWVVWRDEHPPEGGNPRFLAAFFGENAEASATILADTIKFCYPSGQVVASKVRVWPSFETT
jgi:hypothetical protein